MIHENFSLKNLNTFGLDIKASYFNSFSSVDELISQVKTNPSDNLLILGGGSNLLFTKDFDGLVLKNEIKGISLLEDNENHVLLEVGAGENWHEFVLYCVNKSYYGIENLSLIPGNVGASPMQNIGAYGVEVKDVIVNVSYLDLNDLKTKTIENKACNFGYRESIFKHELKSRAIITHVQFKLLKQSDLKTSYGAIEEELKNKGITNPSIKDISDTVISIRQSKLPDPKKIGNSGSFFKNPVISKNQFEILKEKYPTIPAYPQENNSVKVPAGWLIEQAGWKGKKIKHHGVHEKQALVLVNYGGASGDEIYSLSQSIIDDIKQKFGIELEREVNIL